MSQPIIDQAQAHSGEARPAEVQVKQEDVPVSLPEIPSSAETSEGEFHSFPKLAFELRQMIWNFALPGPRVIKAYLISDPPVPQSLEDLETFKAKVDSCLSNLAHCNREARAVVLKKYTWAFGIQFGGNPLLIDFVGDALFLENLAAFPKFFGDTRMISNPDKHVWKIQQITVGDFKEEGDYSILGNIWRLGVSLFNADTLNHYVLKLMVGIER